MPSRCWLRALLLQAFYSVRSERQLLEQLDYNLLFRWFVGLGMDAEVWEVTVFTKNRERLIAGDIAGKFMSAVRAISWAPCSTSGPATRACRNTSATRRKAPIGSPQAASGRRIAAIVISVSSKRRWFPVPMRSA